ncbi:MAG: esterase family protein [Lachnospiraceae bacterium]|nr:esterase family protein [Lachnospiraceae bacterium]MBQ6857726.1 esterase family protein [Lachnospiraceae bacterium]
MEMQYFKEYSPALNRDMECKVYGHAGRPVLFIPCQDGRFFDFEGYKMAEVWSPWIESGDVMVFAIDTIDKETWSDKWGNAEWRINRHEQWISYIVNEMVPFIQAMAMERNGWDSAPGIMTFGCSLGASHAANLFYRFPNHFDSLMALSGIYTSEYGFGTFMNGQVYENSPVHYLANMTDGHPYIDMYNRGRSVICCGLGAWEQPETTRRLAEIFHQKGINTWVDFWGDDVNHDWPWWYKQVVHYLPWLLYQR